MSSATPTPNPDRPRIFGIGLNKTGTTSFGEALIILGFKSLHFGGDDAHRSVQQAIDEGVPLLTYLDPTYDAFSDIGLLSRRFQMLDQQYPGSRFVLTTRPRRRLDRQPASSRRAQPEEAGARGVRRHVPRGRRGEVGERVGPPPRAGARYFGSRPDFLELDLSDDPSWDPLCPFLGVAEPAEPFPWANRGADRSRGPAARLLARFSRS